MHLRWFSTTSLQATFDSPLSAFEPYLKKQSSRSFFDSGHAQHLHSGDERVNNSFRARSDESEAVGGGRGR